MSGPNYVLRMWEKDGLKLVNPACQAWQLIWKAYQPDWDKRKSILEKKSGSVIVFSPLKLLNQPVEKKGTRTSMGWAKHNHQAHLAVFENQHVFA